MGEECLILWGGSQFTRLGVPKEREREREKDKMKRVKDDKGKEL